MFVFFPQDTNSSIWIPDRLIRHKTKRELLCRRSCTEQPSARSCGRGQPDWLTEPSVPHSQPHSSASVHLPNYGIEGLWGKEIYGNCTLFTQFLSRLAATRPEAVSAEGRARAAAGAGRRDKINIEIPAGLTAAAAQSPTRKWLYILYSGLFILSLCFSFPQ